jgi:hypothetical protein
LKDFFSKVQFRRGSIHQGQVLRQFKALTILMLRETLVVLLFGVHLEFHDIPGILCDLFVIANVDIFGNLRNQPHVVTNHHHATLERVQAFGQRVNRLHVEGIRPAESKERYENERYVRGDARGQSGRQNRSATQTKLTVRQVEADEAVRAR